MESRAYLFERLQKEYDFLPAGVLEEMIDALIELDESYMERTGVDDGAVYDDEQAEKEFFTAMSSRFPEHQMYMMRLVSDYLDFNEEYLESIDGIEWE